MNEYEKDSNANRPQNKFLSDMYDDFFWLISSSPDNYDDKIAKEKFLEENHNKISSLDIKSRAEYLREIAEKEAAELKKAQEKLSQKDVKNKSDSIFSEDNDTNKDEEKTEAKKETEQIDTELSEEDKANILNNFYEKVDDLNLTDESKFVLKKMIDYARKYNEKIVKQYIPFNMRIYTDNDETLNSIISVLSESFLYYKYMKSDSCAKRSFFAVEDKNNISDLYSNSRSIVILKDIDGIIGQDKTFIDRTLNALQTNIYAYSNLEGITTIIVDKEKQKIDDLFANHLTLRDKVFDFELYTTKDSVQEIYQSLLNSFRTDYTPTGEFELKLLDYITETYKKSEVSAPEYKQALLEKIIFNTQNDVLEASSIPKYETDKSITEIFEELNDLVGLQNVKDMLNDLVSLIQFKQKAGEDLKIKDTNLHMVFLGNPGTGKTTVARMVSGILYNLKYIKHNKLIEVSAKDLIGQYVGQTAPKTMAVIDRARGGVLFIDEAYSLASKPGSNNSFNEECIATLIQAMENYRDDLVVIFAGYSKEMDAFLKSNSGIVSRIGYTMDFKDYSVDELIQILKSMFKKAGFKVTDDAYKKAEEIINKYKNTEGFGNARFVRNIYEKAILKHATNTQNSNSKKVLKLITDQDITSENLIML